MKAVRLATVLLSALLASEVAFADGSWTNVTVSQISAHTSQGANPNTLWVGFSTSGTGGPTCAASKTYLIIDLTTPGGQAAAASAAQALASSVRVSAGGTGTCSIVSNQETMAYITLL